MFTQQGHLKRKLGDVGADLVLVGLDNGVGEVKGSFNRPGHEEIDQNVVEFPLTQKIAHLI